MMESCLNWRHLAPTAPDTLTCYPYQDRRVGARRRVGICRLLRFVGLTGLTGFSGAGPSLVLDP